MDEDEKQEIQEEQTSEEVQEQVGTVEKESKSSKVLLTAAIFVVLIALVGVYYFFFMNKNRSTEDVEVTPAQQVQTEESMIENGSDNTVGTGSGEAKGVTTEDATEVVVEGSNFLFEPDTFGVSAGEKVRIIFRNTGGIHDLVFDDLDVATEQISTGQESIVEFTAPEEPGEYTFYCSVGNHRAMGMEGVMVVE